MSEEHDLLDDDYKKANTKERTKKFNYLKYTFSYLFLMLLIGALLTKLMSHFPLKPIQLVIGSLAYISFGLAISLLFEIVSFIYRKFISKKPNPAKIHPTWFRILETCFFAWCVIVFITYIGNKVI